MDQETNEDNLTYEEWSEINRIIFVVHDGRTWFSGIWKMEQDFDGTIMLLSGVLDWPHTTYDSIEVHRIIPNDRPDRYSSDNLVKAFRRVMAIRPVKEDPTVHHEGKKVFIRFPEKVQSTHLQLSKPI
ncbi:hypothetical protein LCGC14_1342470 [marine sediment metagenome]|uniref:Uncharacterized protein n=1 Tax=marine sediment metagenome TaxID=412755 RepID=A0A0F9MU44_9ZZZZ